MDCVGKTPLAIALARVTGGDCFDIDDALIKDQKCFVPALRLDVIRDRIAQSKGLLFVSGICLKQVLELAECEPDAHIYMKRMVISGWADEDELRSGPLDGLRDAIAGESRREMRLYHERWQPHLNADIELHRYD